VTAAAPEGRAAWSRQLAVVALAAVGLYLATLSFDFAYDDIPIIARNPTVHSLSNWGAILGAPWWNDALYRPATLATFALDWALSGGRPGVFHAVNVLLHLLATMGVFALAYPVLRSTGAATAALLFAVHPVHVEAVANIVGRAELLATVGVLAAALAYRADARAEAAGLGRRRAAAWLATLTATLLALAAKETGFALPGLLLIVDWLDARAAGEALGARLRRHGLLWVGVTALSVAWLLLWLAKTSGFGPPTIAPGLAGLSLPQRAFAMLPVVPQYARLLLLPIHLSADYSPRFLVAALVPTIATVAGALVLVGAVGVAVLARREVPAVTAGLTWSGAALLIVCNVVRPTEILLAERTMYLPSIGVVLALGALASRLHARHPVAVPLGVGLLVALGCARTVTRIPVWRDNAALFPSIVRDAPSSYRAHWIGGMLAYQSGHRDQGRELLRRALQADSLDTGLLNDFASRQEEDSAWGEAAARLTQAYELKPAATLYAARAIDDWVRAGQFAPAAALVTRAWAADSTFVPLRIARSDLAEAQGNLSGAVALRLSVAREVGRAWQYWLMTASVAERAGACAALDESIARLQALGRTEAVTALSRRRPAVRCRS
jgi:Tfp pilus assembly protein PilF